MGRKRQTETKDLTEKDIEILRGLYIDTVKARKKIKDEYQIELEKLRNENTGIPGNKINYMAMQNASPRIKKELNDIKIENGTASKAYKEYTNIGSRGFLNPIIALDIVGNKSARRHAIEEANNLGISNHLNNYGYVVLSKYMEIDKILEFRETMGAHAEQRLFDDFINSNLNKDDKNYIAEKKIALDAIKYVLDRTREGYKKDESSDKNGNTFNQLTINFLSPNGTQELPQETIKVDSNFTTDNDYE